DVEALVALQPDQPRVERRRERLRRLRLADARLALEQERLLQREREEERRREAAVWQVVRLAQRRLELLDRAKPHHRSVDDGVEPAARARAAAPHARGRHAAGLTAGAAASGASGD